MSAGAATGYAAASTLKAGAGRADLGLETALGLTPLGLVEHPSFFHGFVARPEVVAAGILTVADVASTRYFDLAAIRAATLDPVVTASGDRLRFESFSACNGVHARFDLLADGIEEGHVAFGTTNVDVNQPLRTGLSAVRRTELLHVSVGPDELRLSTPTESHVERKVDLPERWVRGFAEVPQVASRMTKRFETTGLRVAAYLGGLTRSAPGPTVHVALTPGGVRTVPASVPGALIVPGTARLTAARRVARFATKVETFEDDATGSTAWVFHVPGGRLTLVLTPAPFRGFSGEGGLLAAMTQDSDAEGAASMILEHLAWEPRIDLTHLGRATTLSAARLEAGLASLAASGRVGYDLAESSWFHRELPHDPDRATRDNPRLVAGRRLASAGAVRRDDGTWVVDSDSSRHWPDPDTGACTCEWWARHRGQRGPCKHVLAVRVVLTGDERGL